MGFCWRSLVTFCRYWQKVTRRRHVPYAKESTERKLPAGDTFLMQSAAVDKKYAAGGKTKNCH